MELTFEDAVREIPAGLYRHYKGKEYRVISIARHSETLEPMVVYQAQYGDQDVWVRPANMWNEEVEHDGKRIRRFIPVEKNENRGEKREQRNNNGN